MKQNLRKNKTMAMANVPCLPSCSHGRHHTMALIPTDLGCGLRISAKIVESRTGKGGQAALITSLLSV